MRMISWSVETGSGFVSGVCIWSTELSVLPVGINQVWKCHTSLNCSEKSIQWGDFRFFIFCGSLVQRNHDYKCYRLRPVYVKHVLSPQDDFLWNEKKNKRTSWIVELWVYARRNYLVNRTVHLFAQIALINNIVIILELWTIRIMLDVLKQIAFIWISIISSPQLLVPALRWRQNCVLLSCYDYMLCIYCRMFTVFMDKQWLPHWRPSLQSLKLHQSDSHGINRETVIIVAMMGW